MTRADKRGQLRVIGGRWRGRRFTFHAEAGLRPTTDRIRETLFNWLAPAIRDARCADLFAGSGALGLEALSRGAAHCDFVDSSRAALRQIGAHLTDLGAENGNCHIGSALDFLRGATTAYDIVFIDPPFGSGLVAPTCSLLASRGLLAGNARVYVEMAASEPLPELPVDWALYRDKIAGGVAYRLFVVGREQIV